MYALSGMPFILSIPIIQSSIPVLPLPYLAARAAHVPHPGRGSGAEPR